MGRLVLVRIGNDTALQVAVVDSEPDIVGMVKLRQPVVVDGSEISIVPAESCIDFNEDLMLHYNGLVNGAKTAQEAASKMLETYAHPVWAPSPIGQTH